MGIQLPSGTKCRIYSEDTLQIEVLNCCLESRDCIFISLYIFLVRGLTMLGHLLSSIHIGDLPAVELIYGILRHDFFTNPRLAWLSCR